MLKQSFFFYFYIMTRLIFTLLCLLALKAGASRIPPTNDEITGAINISNTDAFCSDDAKYSNIEATTSPQGTPLNWGGTIGKDVWFKFTATKFDVSITVNGKDNPSSTNTLLSPLVALYSFDPATGFISELSATMLSSSNVTSLNKGGLTPGLVYYIRVSASLNNEGTFKLCINNYFAPLKPGQDCGTVSILCKMEEFTQNNVTGAGAKNDETAGTCLGRESNSAWYMWTAGKDGTFTFTITPTVRNNDIDWVLYDLGPGGDCSKVTAANAIRCASGSGVTCTPFYNQTGLSLTETDLREESGCVPGQNGFVKYVDMIAGHNYALIVDNFSGGNNGFHIQFDGTTEFIGPTADIKVDKLNPCTDQQSYTLTSLSSNYNTLKWSFGDGANIANATTEGPFNITYSTPGEKVVVLEAQGANGCTVFKTVKFIVANTPSPPVITPSSLKLCVGETLKLSTPELDLATYHWTGPNGFTSDQQNPEITITGPENAGDYKLFVQVGDCVSNVTTLTIPAIYLKPEAAFDVIVNNACQPLQSFTLVNKSKNFTLVNWDLGADVGTFTTATNGDRIVTYTSLGPRTITLTIENPNGCAVTATQQIDVQLKPQTPIINANQTKFCIGDVLKLEVTEVAGLNYEWTGPNGFTANTAKLEVPLTNFNQAGIYRLVVKNASCQSDPVQFEVPPIAKVPIAIFNTEPQFNTKFSAPLPIVFTNNSKEADSYLWDFGDGTQSTQANPTHTYTQSGTFKITLTAYADEGCSNSVTKGDLVILKNAALFAPNAFSPNGDGVNDEFVVSITNLKKYHLYIYSRLGENLFQTTSIFENWNGSYQNKAVPVGVYYYVIFGRNISNQDVKYTGSITLIR